MTKRFTSGIVSLMKTAKQIKEDEAEDAILDDVLEKMAYNRVKRVDNFADQMDDFGTNPCGEIPTNSFDRTLRYALDHQSDPWETFYDNGFRL